jgi:diguanylate cyclase (GGDEF)-like protein
MRISIKNKIWITLLIIICVFVLLINTIINFQIKDISKGEIFKNMQASALAYQRYSEQRQSLLLSKAEAISQTPYLKATLSIPDLDKETLAYTMSNINVSDDISLLLILDSNATLKIDMERSELASKNLEFMPGITAAFNGENYYGYWHYQDGYYRVAISPSITHNQLLGIVVLGQKLTELSQLSIIEDVSGAQAMVRYENEFHSVSTQNKVFKTLLQENAYPIANITKGDNDTANLSDITLPKIKTKNGMFYAISLPFHDNNAELILYKEQTSLLASLNQFQQIIIFVSLFTLIFGIAISGFISFRISKPLSQIMAAVRKYGNGDFSTKITKISKDELGDLSLAFNQMGDDIVESRKNLLDRKEAEEKMRKLAYIDELTGLPNRRFFMKKLETLIYCSDNNKIKFALIFIYVYNFKRINDSLGHDLGDELLKQFSQRLDSSIRYSDTLAFISEEFKYSNVSRLGGDEFTILLGDIEETDDVMIVANRIKEAFVKPFLLDKNEVYVTGSLGGAVFPEHGTNSNNLLKHADVAMYEAKNLGKNTFMLYSKTMDKDTKERLELESDIRKAFFNNEFVVYYQPVIDIKTKNIIGAEALVRWQHPVNGLMFPDSFIFLVEELGFINQLSDYVLSQSCKSFLKWRGMGFTLNNIAVNFSAIQFNQSNVHDRVNVILDELKFPPKYLTIEITESVLLNAETSLINMLKKLKSQEITISLDDFGTGYSSLKYLSTLPIDILKIDKSFTSDITLKGDTKGIVTAIIAMAESLKLEIIAEGVEISEQLHFLSKNKVNLVQGFYFSEAITSDEFEKILLNPGYEYI